ncbi:MAG: GNAT family N-acetyltransferase, partial [Synechococcus sp. SB0670_bin_20]|nr:GNAT family N-acetyltransferase [Synechococcus sp. SB0670_bin_20]
MGEITIRDAGQGDVPALLRLLGQLDPPGEAPGEPAAGAALDAIGCHPGVRLVVAEVAGEVVGSVMLAVLPNLSHHSMPFAQLENLIVD